jgi:DNA-binding GntR family transcriptional regulator
LSDSAYEQIHDMIVRGDLAPGDSLLESTLARSLGLSRTPVREAMRRLEHDGLIERADRGMRVTLRSPHEILEIYEVRILLEGAAARAAAQRRDAYDLARLRQVHELMVSTPKDDAESMSARNQRFHALVWEMSHNVTLIDILQRLNAHVARYRQTTLTFPARWQTALREHKLVIEAIEARDPERAGSAAEAHMTGARDTRLKMYAAQDVADLDGAGP